METSTLQTLITRNPSNKDFHMSSTAFCSYITKQLETIDINNPQMFFEIFNTTDTYIQDYMKYDLHSHKCNISIPNKYHHTLTHTFSYSFLMGDFSNSCNINRINYIKNKKNTINNTINVQETLLIILHNILLKAKLIIHIINVYGSFTAFLTDFNKYLTLIKDKKTVKIIKNKRNKNVTTLLKNRVFLRTINNSFVPTNVSIASALKQLIAFITNKPLLMQTFYKCFPNYFSNVNYKQWKLITNQLYYATANNTIEYAINAFDCVGMNTTLTKQYYQDRNADKFNKINYIFIDIDFTPKERTENINNAINNLINHLKQYNIEPTISESCRGLHIIINTNISFNIHHDKELLNNNYYEIWEVFARFCGKYFNGIDTSVAQINRVLPIMFGIKINKETNEQYMIFPRKIGKEHNLSDIINATLKIKQSETLPSLAILSVQKKYQSNINNFSSSEQQLIETLIQQEDINSIYAIDKKLVNSKYVNKISRTQKNTLTTNYNSAKIIDNYKQYKLPLYILSDEDKEQNENNINNDFGIPNNINNIPFLSLLDTSRLPQKTFQNTSEVINYCNKIIISNFLNAQNIYDLEHGKIITINNPYRHDDNPSMFINLKYTEKYNRYDLVFGDYKFNNGTNAKDVLYVYNDIYKKDYKQTLPLLMRKLNCTVTNIPENIDITFYCQKISNVRSLPSEITQQAVNMSLFIKCLFNDLSFQKVRYLLLVYCHFYAYKKEELLSHNAEDDGYVLITDKLLSDYMKIYLPLLPSEYTDDIKEWILNFKLNATNLKYLSNIRKLFQTLGFTMTNKYSHIGKFHATNLTSYNVIKIQPFDDYTMFKGMVINTLVSQEFKLRYPRAKNSLFEHNRYSKDIKELYSNQISNDYENIIDSLCDYFFSNTIINNENINNKNIVNNYNYIINNFKR